MTDLEACVETPKTCLLRVLLSWTVALAILMVGGVLVNAKVSVVEVLSHPVSIAEEVIIGLCFLLLKFDSNNKALYLAMILNSIITICAIASLIYYLHFIDHLIDLLQKISYK